VTAGQDPDCDPPTGDFDGAAPGGDVTPRVPPRARPRGPGGRRIRGLEPEQRRQERRRQLLDSALQLFATQGYAKTSIEQICQGAYVGFKGFYDEFATKEALFLALYQEQVDRVSTALVAVVEDREFTKATVRSLLDAFVREVIDDPRVGQVLFVEAAGLSPAVEAVRRSTYRSFADMLFEMWVHSPEVRVLAPPPEEVRNPRISLGLVGAIVELMVDWLVDPKSEDIGALVDDLDIFCQVLLAGLVATWPGQEMAPAP
jgi:AcrR family transcriptional regulator